jgi:hypothetical protein
MLSNLTNAAKKVGTYSCAYTFVPLGFVLDVKWNKLRLINIHVVNSSEIIYLFLGFSQKSTTKEIIKHKDSYHWRQCIYYIVLQCIFIQETYIRFIHVKSAISWIGLRFLTYSWNN